MQFSPDHPIGFHFSRSKTLIDTVTRAIYETPLTAIQIYLGSGRGFKLPTFTIEDCIETSKFIKTHRLWMCIHGCLHYNLAGSTKPNDPDIEYKLNRCRNCLIRELDYGALVGCGVVIHMATSKDYDTAVKKMQESIVDVLTRVDEFTIQSAKALNITPQEFVKKRKLILENSSHEGTKIGWDWKGIREILDGVEEVTDQVKVCIDTAHSYGSGWYNFGKLQDVEAFFEEVDVDRIDVIHLNDSKAEFGSHLDRHQNLMKGNQFGDGTDIVDDAMKECTNLFDLVDLVAEKYESQEKTEGYKSLKLLVKKCFEHNIAIIGEPPTSGEHDWAILEKMM